MSDQDDAPPSGETNSSGRDAATEQEDEAPSLDEPDEEGHDEDGEQVNDGERGEQGTEGGEQAPEDEETAPLLTEADDSDGEEATEDTDSESGSEAASESAAEGGGEGEADEADPSAGEATEDEAEDAAEGAQDEQAERGEQPFPPDLERHVFEGELRPSGRAVGYHHREGGEDHGDAKVVESSKTAPDEHGVYEANWTTTRPDGSTAEKKSSFFPDSYSQADVRNATREAFDNRSATSVNGQWEGVTSDGMTIQGYVRPGVSVDDAAEDDISTAYPIWQGRHRR